MSNENDRVPEGGRRRRRHGGGGGGGGRGAGATGAAGAADGRAARTGPAADAGPGPRAVGAAAARLQGEPGQEPRQLRPLRHDRQSALPRLPARPAPRSQRSVPSSHSALVSTRISFPLSFFFLFFFFCLQELGLRTSFVFHFGFDWIFLFSFGFRTLPDVVPRREGPQLQRSGRRQRDAVKAKTETPEPSTRNLFPTSFFSLLFFSKERPARLSVVDEAVRIPLRAARKSDLFIKRESASTNRHLTLARD